MSAARGGVLVILFALAACTSDAAPAAAPNPATTPAPVPSATTSIPVPSAMPMPTATALPPRATTPPGPVHQLLLKQPSLGAWLLLDRTHLYWIADEEGYHLYRYPLAGGSAPEIIATSQFVNDDASPNRHGVLGVIRPVLTGDLLVYLDTKYPLLNPIWDLHVRNLAQGADTVLLRGDNVRFTPHFTAQGDWLGVSTGEMSKDPACDGDDTVLLIYNLKAHEQRELDRSCTHRLWVWGDPHLVGNELSVEQWFGNNSIKYVTFNLLNDTRTVKSREEYEQHHPPTERWTILATGHELLVSDHETQRLLTIATAGEDQWIQHTVIFGNTIAWSRILKFPQGGPRDILLEWRVLP